MFVGTAGPGDLLHRDGTTSKLNLIGTKTLDSGVVILFYQPVAEQTDCA